MWANISRKITKITYAPCQLVVTLLRETFTVRARVFVHPHVDHSTARQLHAWVEHSEHGKDRWKLHRSNGSGKNVGVRKPNKQGRPVSRPSFAKCTWPFRSFGILHGRHEPTTIRFWNGSFAAAGMLGLASTLPPNTFLRAKIWRPYCACPVIFHHGNNLSYTIHRIKKIL